MGGLLYAYVLSIPAPVAVPTALAVAIELCLYVAAVLEPVRAWLQARLRPPALAAWMTASALLPYCLYSIPAGTFDTRLCIVLAAAAGALSFWYVVFPRRAAVDVLFVVFVAAVLLSPLFAAIYTPPAPRLPLGILGQSAWTRLAFLAALSIARMEVKGVGLWPDRREWAAGFLHFAFFLPVGALLGWAVRFASFHLRPMPWWQMLALAAGTFLGMLWVVALREEFFFRGMLQEWFERWLRSGWLGLAAASVLFGLVHLPFRGFPNWRFALLAAVAGLFYGRAYQATRSVRAAMVTHALVNTTWRILFY